MTTTAEIEAPPLDGTATAPKAIGELSALLTASDFRTAQHPHRLPVLDYARVALSIFVVIWHACGPTLVDWPVIGYNVLLIAVPGFYAISLFLYARTSREAPYLVQRLKHLATLLLFWTCSYWLVMRELQYLSHYLTSFNEFLFGVFSAFDTGYYFFASLLMCTAMCHYIAKSSTAAIGLGCLLAAAAQIACPAMALSLGLPNDSWAKKWLTSFASPLNFLVYPFLSPLLVRLEGASDRVRRHLVLCGCIATPIVAAVEWAVLRSDDMFAPYILPPYARLSPPLMAYSLLLAACEPGLREVKANACVGYMARSSQALYCLQFFLFPLAWHMIYATPLISVVGEPASQLCAALLVVLMSYACSELLTFALNRAMLYGG